MKIQIELEIGPETGVVTGMLEAGLLMFERDIQHVSPERKSQYLMTMSVAKRINESIKQKVDEKISGLCKDIDNLQKP